MSKTVDQRVVEMRFDNSNFETNAKATMSTLDKLKNALNFSSSSNSFKELEKASKDVDMGHLGNAVESVKEKFSALEVVGITALVNITNKAVNAGTQLIKSLTVDQIIAGWDKYEQKVQAVQTIVSQGYDYDNVTAQLEKLNWFTDETSYSFLDMVNNIGKFTAQGQDLNKSVTAMEGISNWAALSGAGINGASRAMYNLSQALGVGYVKVQDWMSIENANMATKEFKETVIKTAKELGTLSKKTKVNFATFRNTLKDNWLTSDVLMATLEKYGKFTDELNSFVSASVSDDFTATKALQLIDEYMDTGKIQNLDEVLKDTGYTAEYLYKKLKLLSSSEYELGRRAFKAAQEATTLTQAIASVKDAASTAWMQIFETVFGGYDEARVTWTSLANDLYDIFVPSLTGINDTLSGAFDSSWQKMKKTIASTGLSTADFVDALQANLEKGGIKVDELTSKWGSFETGLMHVDNASKYVSETLLDYVAILDKMSASELENEGITRDQIEIMRSLADTTNENNKNFYGLIKTFDKLGGKELLAQSLHNALTAILNVIETIKEAFSDIFPPVTEKQVYSIIKKINELSEKLILSEESLEKLKNAFSGVFAVMDIFKQIIQGIATVISKVLSAALDGVGSKFLNLSSSAGNALVAFDNWLKDGNYIQNIFNKIADTLADLIAKIKTFIRESEIVATVKDYFTDMAGSIAEAAKSGEGFFSVFNKLKDFTSNMFSSIDKNGLKVAIDTELDDTTKSINKFASSFSNTLDTLSDVLGRNQLNIKNIVNSIADVFEEKTHFDLGTLVAVGSNVGMIVMLREMNKTLASFSEIVPTFGKYFDTISKSISECAKKLAKAKSFEIMTDGIKNIAYSMLILAASMLVISKIDTDKFGQTVAVVGGFTVAMMVFVGIMTKLSAASKETLKISLNISASFIAIAGAVLILTSAIQALESIKLGDLLKGFVTVVALLYVMLKIGQGITKFAIGSTGSFAALALALLAIAASVDILTVGLVMLSNIKLESLVKGFLSLLAIMLTFTGVASALLAVSKGSSAKAILSLITISASLLAFAIAIKWIGNMDFSGIKKNIPVMAGIIGSFIAILVASNLAGTASAGASVAILSMTSSIIVLAIGIRMLASISEEELKAASNSISKLIVVFGLAVALSSLAGENATKAGLMLLEMAGALAIISVIVALLGKVDGKTLAKGVAVVAALVTIMSILVAVTGFSKYADKLKGTLTKFTSIIAILSFCIITLSLIDTKSALGAAGSIALVVASLGVLMLAFGSGGFKNIENIKWVDKAKALLFFAGVIAVIGGIVALLTKIVNPKAAIPLATGIGELLLALSFSLGILSTIDSILHVSKDIIHTIVMFAAIIAVFGVIISTMSNWANNPSTLIPLATAISELLLALSVSLTILSLDVFNASKLTGGTALSIIAMGVVVALLGGILYHLTSDIGDNADRCIPIAASISLFALAMAGALAILSLAGIASASALWGVLDMAVAVVAIAGLACLLGLLQEYNKYLDPGLEVMKKIGEGIIELAGLFLNTIIDSLISAIPKLGAALSDMADKLGTFTTFVSGLDSSIVSGTAYLIAMFAELGAAELLSSIQNIIGISNFDSFKSKLLSFGEAVTGYATLLKESGFTDADMAMISASANAGKGLVDLTKAMGDGSIFTFFDTITDISTFSARLIGFGTALVAYSNIIAGMNLAAVTASNSAIQMVVDLANNLPETKTLGGWFSADDANHLNLVEFGTQLVLFGNALVGYSIIVTGVNTSAVESSSVAAGMLVDLANTLPETKNLKGWFSSKDPNHLDLADFGKQLRLFGASLALYSIEVLGVNSEAIKKSVDAAEMLVTLANGLPETKNLKGWFSSKDANHLDMADFGKQIITFGESLKSYSKHVKNVSDDTVSKTTNITASLTQLANNLPAANTIAGWLKGTNKKSLGDFGKDIADFGKEMKNYYASIKNVDATKMNSVSDAVVKLVNALNKGNEIKSTKSLFSTGQDVAQGFINGVLSKLNAAGKAGSRLGNATKESLQKALDIHSPSKVMEELGNFTGEGFIEGISNTVSKLKTAIGNLKDTAVSGLTSVATTIKDELANTINIDTDSLTITPVLDLSEIQNGVGDINSMIGDYSGINLGASFDMSSLTDIGSTSLQRQLSLDSLAQSIKSLNGGQTATTNNNTFNITGDDPQSIAEEVSKILQEQVERSNATWA